MTARWSEARCRCSRRGVSVPIYFPYETLPGTVRFDLWFTDRTLGAISLGLNDGDSSLWGLHDAQLVGHWFHVVLVVHDGPLTGNTMFIDGQPATSSCVLYTCAGSRAFADPVTIGGPDVDYPWHGLVDDVRIYDRELTAAEVGAIATCAP